MQEVTHHADNCPNRPIESGAPGLPPLRFTITRIHDAKLLKGALAVMVRTRGTVNGKKVDQISYAVYQRLGNVLSGTYSASAGPNTPGSGPAAPRGRAERPEPLHHGNGSPSASDRLNPSSTRRRLKCGSAGIRDARRRARRRRDSRSRDRAGRCRRDGQPRRLVDDGARGPRRRAGRACVASASATKPLTIHDVFLRAAPGVVQVTATRRVGSGLRDRQGRSHRRELPRRRRCAARARQLLEQRAARRARRRARPGVRRRRSAARTLQSRALTPLELGNSDLVRVGDSVAAIGNPLGSDRSITSGIVTRAQLRALTGTESRQTQPRASGNVGRPAAQRARQGDRRHLARLRDPDQHRQERRRPADRERRRRAPIRRGRHAGDHRARCDAVQAPGAAGLLVGRVCPTRAPRKPACAARRSR